MEPEQIKHLEFIQDVITRMNSNSFHIKGWAITFVAALLALYANSSNVTYILVAIAPTILFWFLDAFYLQQERKFVGLYYDVVKYENTIPLFNMSIKKYSNGNCRFCCVFWSKTIAWLYGSVCILLLFVGLVLKYNDGIIITC